MFEALKHLVYVSVLVGAGYGLFYVLLTPAFRRELQFRPALIFIGMAAVGYLSPNLYVLHAAAFLAVPLSAARRRHIGPAAFVAVLAIPDLSAWLQLGGVPLYRYSVQTTVLLGALAAFLMSGNRPKVAVRPADLFALALLVLLVIGNARGTAATNVLRETVSTGLWLILPYFVFTRTVLTLSDLQKAMAWIGSAAVILALILIFERLRSWPLYNPMLSMPGIEAVGGSVINRLGGIRAEGPLLNAVLAGFVLVFGFAATLASRRAFQSKYAHLLLAGVVALGLIAPQSRGAWLGAAIVALATAAYRIRKGEVTLVTGSAFAAGVVGTFLVWLATRAGDLGSTVDYRERLLERGLEEFWERPLTGDSFTNVTARLADLTQGEGIVDFVNAYLHIMLTTGAVGALAFGLAFLLPLRQLWMMRAKLQKVPDGPEAGAMCFASIAAIVVMLAFSSFIGHVGLVSVICIGIAGTLSTRRALPKRVVVAVHRSPKAHPL